jgi:hypothetical protein
METIIARLENTDIATFVLEHAFAKSGMKESTVPGVSPAISGRVISVIPKSSVPMIATEQVNAILQLELVTVFPIE